MNQITTVTKENIQDKIFTIRGLQVMLDEDLAELYQVESKRLNEQVKRNLDRFPEHFRFQLTEDEYQNLRSQFATSSSQYSLRSQIATLAKHGGRRYLPYVFTEQGVAMLSSVLKSKIAVQVSIQIMDTFVNMRKLKIEIKKFENLHDRFLILDNKEVYHIGASLKDLGKKWFAFSKFDMKAFDIVSKLEKGNK